MQATEIEDIINDSDITDLIMTVLVILVLVGVAVGIYRKFS